MNTGPRTVASRGGGAGAAPDPGLATGAARIARVVYEEFTSFYAEFSRVPAQAQAAFEQRDFARSVGLSARRLSLYTERIGRLGEPLQRARADGWDAVEASYLALVEGIYEADVAIAFLHSARRKLFEGEWTPVEYSFGSVVPEGVLSARILRTFAGGPGITAAQVRDVLAIPGFAARFRDLDADAVAVAARVNEELRARAQDGFEQLEMVNAGFFRNRGAYLVGRLSISGERYVPLVLALVNDADGIYVDAVVTTVPDAHNLFSSTLANFHVTNPYYHQLCEFLAGIMPTRPLGLHYSTIGYNHLGKVAVMNELRAELHDFGQTLRTSPGFRGTVAIGFAAPSSAYNLKVVRDHPTDGYKWGVFDGVDSVLRKYAAVHDINRTGSMLDSIIYYNLSLDRAWFDPELLEELARECSNAVSVRGDSVLFRYLIVQRRLLPLPVFLADASEEDARATMIDLGYCIKNNAAANIFNKDLDARNYGVSRTLKVYLFDYDALETFVDVKIQSSADRFDGEEEVPDWFFEDGYVFLPEEIEVGLRIPNRDLRRLFAQVHGDLSTSAYWTELQDALRAGNVPAVRVYPESARLHPR